MRRKELYSLLALVILRMTVSNCAYAQLSLEKQGREVVMPNSQTYDFIRYGTVGASLYTGTVNYSVPVYTYKDSDFELPISLDYAFNGYKPNTRAGELGVGWTLNAGGCITREVKGIPDDAEVSTMSALNTQPQQVTTRRGFIFLPDNINSYPLMYDYQPDGTPFFYWQDRSTNKNYDIEPDIFYFNFLGYSGHFHLWENGEVKVYSSNSNEKIKVEIMEYDIDNLKKIKITTANGYEYYFGSHNYADNEYYRSLEECNNITYTWKLATIAAPNGRTIQFIYDTIDSYYNYIGNYQPTSNYKEKWFESNFEWSQSATEELKTQESSMYSLPLKKIQISDGPQIDFSYTSTSGETFVRMSYRTPVVYSCNPSYKLTQIKVTNDNLELGNCNLSYKNSSNGNKIYFLGTVDIKGTGTYDFEYNNRTTTDFPAFGLYNVDHWGYYNGGNNTAAVSSPLQGITHSTDFTENTQASRSSSYSSAIVGGLSKIIYPTGGYSIVTYQPHSYSKKLERSSATSFLPFFKTLSSTFSDVGGVRVENVKTYNTTDELISTKKYLYTEPNGLSSGTLLHFPRYGIKYYAQNNAFVKYSYYYSLYDLYQYAGTHIEYSRVIEENTDGSKTVYNFTNSSKYADSISFDPLTVTGTLKTMFQQFQPPLEATPITSYISNLRNILTPINSLQSKRGKLESVETFNASNTLLRKNENDYAEFHRLSYYIPAALAEEYRTTRIDHFNFWQTGFTQTENRNGANVTTQTSYQYNSNGLIASITTTFPNGDQEITRYQYAANLTGEPYTTLKTRHLLNYPYTIQSYSKKAGGGEVQTGGKRYTYALFNNLIKPSQLETFNLLTSSWQPETVFNSYDNKGNLTQSTDANGITTAYIWGHNGLYLIAKGVNVSYGTLSSYVGTSGLLSGGTTADHSTVRNNCPNALIDFYEYKPFVGISKHMDPSGKVFTYSYNASGKLKAVTDENGKLYNEYLYSSDNK